MSLETGGSYVRSKQSKLFMKIFFSSGLVIGWFNLVSNILGFLAAVVCTLVLTIYDCDDLKEALEHAGETTVESEFDKACSIGRGG